MVLNSTLIKVISLISLLLFVRCNSDDSIESSQDSIKIISVSPSSGLQDGVAYEFRVETEYQLKTFDKGGVSISFNLNGVNSYRAITGAHSSVKKGNGNHVFEVSVEAKDWKTEGDFRVLVSLYESVVVIEGEEPRDPQNLASDTAVLSFAN